MATPKKESGRGDKHFYRQIVSHITTNLAKIEIITKFSLILIWANYILFFVQFT